MHSLSDLAPNPHETGGACTTMRTGEAMRSGNGFPSLPSTNGYNHKTRSEGLAEPPVAHRRVDAWTHLEHL